MDELTKMRDETVAKNRQGEITTLAIRAAQLVGTLKKQRAMNTPVGERTKTQRELDATLAELGKLEAVSKLASDAS